MSWREIKAKWEADPAFREAFDEDYPYASVASAVARLRADNDLTQADLAERVGTTQSVIARLEGGRHPVSVALLRRIARALDMVWEPAFRPADQRSAPAAQASTAINVVDPFDPGQFMGAFVIEAWRWGGTFLGVAGLSLYAVKELEENEWWSSIELRPARTGFDLFANTPLGGHEGRTSVAHH